MKNTAITIQLPNEIKRLGLLFERSGKPLYAVGGLVRNALLGYPPSDWDICGALLPEEVMALFKDDTEIQIVPKAVKFGTIELHMTGEDGFRRILEYTTFRSDSYDGSMHRPERVVFSSLLEKDAFRRDFSINALYADATTGEVFDPTGGIADLKARLLRTSNPDPDAIMRDDGLRVLRLVRLACELGFDIEPASYKSAKRNAQGLSAIAKERIWQETQKILLSDARYTVEPVGGNAAHYRALLLLHDLGALPTIFPELMEGEGVQQSVRYHAYDVLHHSLHACENTPPDLELRLAALLHDVAKPRMNALTGKMLGHDKAGEALASVMLERLRVGRQTIERVSALIAEHMFDLDGQARENTCRMHFAKLGEQAARQLILLREADVVGSGKTGKPVATAEKFRAILDRMKAQHVPFSPNDLDIRGDEIMEALALPPSRRIGEIKHSLWMHCVVKPVDNKNERLKRLCRTYETRTKE